MAWVAIGPFGPRRTTALRCGRRHRRANLTPGLHDQLRPHDAERVGAVVGLGDRPAADDRAVPAGEEGPRELVDRGGVAAGESHLGMGGGEEDDGRQAEAPPGELLVHEVAAHGREGEASQLRRPAETGVAERRGLAEDVEEERSPGHHRLRGHAVDRHAGRPQHVGGEAARGRAQLRLILGDRRVVLDIVHGHLW
jgi:hypothetical protein